MRVFGLRLGIGLGLGLGLVRADERRMVGLRLGLGKRALGVRVRDGVYGLG